MSKRATANTRRRPLEWWPQRGTSVATTERREGGRCAFDAERHVAGCAFNAERHVAVDDLLADFVFSALLHENDRRGRETIISSISKPNFGSESGALVLRSK